MKNFLAIDTSSKYMTVLAVKKDKSFLSYTPDCAMKHSVLLMEKIDETLRAADMSLQDCDFFAAVVGAGSFTGIRIGIATVKGFCLATGKPALPVTSFDVAAYNAVDGERTLALVDALHGNYYACGFDEQKRRILSPSYISEEGAEDLFRQGYSLVSAEEIPLSAKLPVNRADPAEGLFRAVCALSAEKANFGELKALYIRKSQAEENRKEN